MAGGAAIRTAGAAVALCLVVAASACGGSGTAQKATAPPAASTSWVPLPPSAAQAGGGRVSVFPSPGTQVASPGSTISIRGVASRRVGRITVIGSSSGRHDGRLVAHSDGHGASFVPAKPFAPGERVTVRTHLRIRGATGGRFGFTVARPVPDPLLDRPEPAGRSKVLTFRSEPGLRVPKILVTKRSPAAATGSVFVTPRRGAGQNGPTILSADGELVWFRPMRNGVQATDLREQRYEGKPVLTWWQGRLGKGHGYGVGLVVDDRYRTVARVEAGNGYSADLHEFLLTSRDTALVTAYRAVRWDLTPVGGPRNGVAFDGVVQEIDVKTGSVLFEWHSLGNVPLAESYGKPDGKEAFDYFHVNGIATGAGGDLLVSSRGAHTVYDIDGRTGAIRWRLGGKHSSFALGPGVRFHSQHDPTWLDASTISIFDNGAGVGGGNHKSSRGIVVHLDLAARKASLVRAFVQPQGRLFTSQGDVQRLPNGNFFVGWGEGPSATGFTPSGQVAFSLHLATGQSYRAYRYDWHGAPATKPALAAVRRGSSTVVYASWNGATDVAQWEVLAGSTAGDLTRVTAAPSDGFETEVTARTTAPFVSVRALDAAGNELGVSKPVRVRSS